MVTASVGTFIWKLTSIYVVTRILLTTFTAHFSSSTVVFVMAVFLVFIASQGVIELRNDFFFILSFFVGYILSFGFVRLRTIRLSAREDAHIECRCSRSCAEDVTITDVIIKTPDRKWTGVWMTSCQKAMGWEFWRFLKKAINWDLTMAEASWDLSLGEASWFLSLGDASPVGAYGMRRAFVGSEGTVSIVKIVCLSLLVSKD